MQKRLTITTASQQTSKTAKFEPMAFRIGAS